MVSYNDPVELGTVLRLHREKLHLKQKDVATLLDVQQPTVHRWEKGRRPEPEFFDRIARFLDITRDEVIRLAHTPAEDDGLEELIAARGPGWFEKPIEERRRIVAHMRELLEPE